MLSGPSSVCSVPSTSSFPPMDYPPNMRQYRYRPPTSVQVHQLAYQGNHTWKIVAADVSNSLYRPRDQLVPYRGQCPKHPYPREAVVNVNQYGFALHQTFTCQEVLQGADGVTPFEGFDDAASAYPSGSPSLAPSQVSGASGSEDRRFFEPPGLRLGSQQPWVEYSAPPKSVGRPVTPPIGNYAGIPPQQMPMHSRICYSAASTTTPSNVGFIPHGVGSGKRTEKKGKMARGPGPGYMAAASDPANRALAGIPVTLVNALDISGSKGNGKGEDQDKGKKLSKSTRSKVQRLAEYATGTHKRR